MMGETQRGSCLQNGAQLEIGVSTRQLTFPAWVSQSEWTRAWALLEPAPCKTLLLAENLCRGDLLALIPLGCKPALPEHALFSCLSFDAG